jgi:protease-4
VTNVDYVDVLVSKITEAITGNPESDDDFFVEPKVYAAAVQREGSEKALVHGRFTNNAPHVALVYVTGAIMDTRISASAPAGLADEGIAAADEIAPALMEAADDPQIKAVIVRIDSPGGSPAASETILRAIDKIREKKKPVIISMGATAASGGYWVAAHADRIFAAPTTLTGSIGVVGGKFSIAGLSEKLGVNWDGVSWGDNSEIWSMNKPFSASESERMNAMLDFVYEAFLKRVSEGRKMTVADVDKIAGGRVWTGRRASGIGLVDELGGLREAMEYTAKTLGAEDRFGLNVLVMPKPLTPFEEIMQLVGTQATVYEGLKFTAMLSKTASPVMNRWSVLNSMGPVSTYEPMAVR